ncbi:Uncharacterised protein [[Clostridium] sordellii]|uniref:hypothetical protein n=1 Tax=Paraclostridium sordellii TaxID=1505 RepID=UPI0005E3C563|nr:hypothetical protein [Paeniclostridium sordellii]CEQ11117.1 Uncharacterised protein [[Clostridium] sordellii] [Paeniclostridium sordellii]
MNNPIFIKEIFLISDTGRCKAEFREGLNIVISIDIGVDKLEAKKEKIRNSVGKTTFVNLIDYIFGKSKFISEVNEDTEEFFRERYIIGYVSFHGQKFTIKRSILFNDEIYVYRNWIKKDVLKLKDNSNLEMIDDIKDTKSFNKFLTKKIYNNTNIFDDKIYTSHRQIMNFLIRDQYHGFNNFNSGIKSERAEYKKDRLDFLLGLVTKEIQELKLKIETLKKEKSELNNEKKILNNYFEMKFGNKDELIDEIKAINSNKSIIEEELLELKNSDRSGHEEKLNILMSKKIELTKSLDELNNSLEIFKSKYKNYNLAINEICNELYKLNTIESSIDIFNSFKVKKCPYTSKDLKNKCEFLNWDDELDFKKLTEARKKILIYEKDDLNKAIKKTELISQNFIKDREGILENLNKLENEILNNKIDYNDLIKKLETKVVKLEKRKSILEEQLINYNYINELVEKISGKKKILKNCIDTINNLKENIIEDLNSIFNKIIQYLTNNGRDGKIDNKTYEPYILFKESNRRDTGAAMKNLAIIAFDIALLEFSLKTKVDSYNYPRFLVHDSPRKNDLQEYIYFNIFKYIIKLEKEYFEKGRYFQYIITTLDVPEEVNKEEYIKLELDNSGSGGKLFGRDIGI